MSFGSRIRPPKLLKRIDLLYFVLAGVDLITICAVLLLSHSATSAFERGVRESSAISTLQFRISELARFAQGVDGPGNDVFSTRQILVEKARYLEAVEGYEQAHTRALAGVRAAAIGEFEPALLRYLEEAHASLHFMSTQSDRIFAQYAQGNISGAAASMAAMDHRNGLLHATLDRALAVVERARAKHLENQLEIATNTRQLEHIFTGGVFAIVCLVALYGMHIGRTLRATDQHQIAMVSQLAAARDRLQRYADDVSHELRGPISKMRLSAELLLMKERSPEDYQGGIEDILVQGGRLSSIVDSLLFLARVENVDTVIQTASLDAGTELELIADFYGASAEANGVYLEIGAAKGAFPADRSLFQRAVGNIVANAIRHTKAGGRVVIGAHEVKDWVEIEVTDTGAGISPDQLPHIFDRFYRGSNGSGGDGLGLGLAIAKSIMDLHHGEIDIQSQIDVGTRATLRFRK